MPSPPAAFMSYSQFDDKHDGGFLTDFRERLASEVRAYWGQEFKVFQDIKDIGWGADWKARLDEALGTATFLIPIITPNFFQSEACKREVRQFDVHERKLASNDLILPLYYIETPQFEEFAKFKRDHVVSILHRHQSEDWRELRHLPIQDISVQKKIGKLAQQITKIIRLSMDQAASEDDGREASAQPTSAQPAGRARRRGRPQPEKVQQPGRSLQSDGTPTGFLHAVPPPAAGWEPLLETAQEPWLKLAVLLQLTTFEEVDWRLFAVRTREIRRALAQQFPPFPGMAEEVSSVMDALSRALRAGAASGAAEAQVRSSANLAEQLRLILIDLITNKR
jgi:hypothetical protein